VDPTSVSLQNSAAEGLVDSSSEVVVARSTRIEEFPTAKRRRRYVLGSRRGLVADEAPLVGAALELVAGDDVDTVLGALGHVRMIASTRARFVPPPPTPGSVRARMPGRRRIRTLRITTSDRGAEL
jgi:hypothetical protein